MAGEGETLSVSESVLGITGGFGQATVHTQYNIESGANNCANIILWMGCNYFHPMYTELYITVITVM